MVPDATRARRQAAQAKAFDQIGAAYDQAFPFKEGQLAAGEWLVERLPPGARVLDVGCGTGLPTARRLVDAGFKVTGIDISEGMLQLSRQNVPEATFTRLDVAELAHPDLADPDLTGLHPVDLGPVNLDPADPGLEDTVTPLGPFDAIVDFFCLLMLPRAEIPPTLLKLHDLLRPGGYFLLGMVEEDLDDAPIVFLGSPVRVTGYPRGELRSLVMEAGFEILDLTSVAYTPKGDAWPEIQIFLRCRRPDR
jgi:SAM-dependent methyltransferase